MSPDPPAILGLRTVIYPAPDLEATKAAFTELLGVGPYFDEPFYVGFELSGYELGLSPAADVAAGPVTYWGVPDAEVALAALLARGAREREPVSEVGGGIRVASVLVAGDAVLGIIENPVFSAAERPAQAEGPGR